MSKRWMIWVALVAVFGLLAAACGGDDDASPDVTDTTEPETSDPETSEPETTEPEEEIVLTDSFRGVTAETITIGHSSIDFVDLNETFGLDLAFQDFRPTMDAIVAWYNEQGGVLGREIVVIHETYLPVGPVTAEEACVKLTEDVETFAILNGFSGAGAENVNECITEFHDTVLVGGLPTAAQGAAAGGLWVTPDMSLDRRNPAVVTLMDEAGILDDLGSMMVVGSNPDEETLVNQMADALREVGVEVPATAFITTTGDEQATQGEVEVFISRARAEGVETIVLLGEGEFRNQAFFRLAPDFTYIMGNGDRITDWQSIPPEGLSADTRVITNNNGPSPVDDPRIQECIAVVEEALGIDIIATEELPDGDPNYWSGMSGGCQRMALFVQVAEAAGPELTNDSWVAALDQVPDLSLPGYQFVSLSSDKIDARDQLVVVEYDLATLSFVPISDPIDVG